MFIHNASIFLTKPANDSSDLKKELERYSSDKFRRANRFILLSLIGAYRCIANRSIHPFAAVYLTTENGNLGNTESVLEQIYYKRELPLPYSFINTMSNTASFYAAQKMNLSGINLTVSGGNLSFERGLELLKTDVSLNRVTEALIGGADESAVSNRKFKEMLHARYEGLKSVEGSAWLYIKTEKQGAVGQVMDIQSFSSPEDGREWLIQHPKRCHPNTVVSFGLLIEPPEREWWKNTISCQTEFDYIRENGYFDSITSCGVSRFLEIYPHARMVHINKDSNGQYVIIIMDSF